MIDTTEYRFLSKMNGAFGSHFLFGGIFALLKPSLLGFPYCILMLWATYKHIRCAYLTENFTEYASYTLLSTLYIACYICYLSILLVLLMHFKMPIDSAMVLATTTLIPPLTLYIWAYGQKKYKTPFIKNGLRVETSTPDSSTSPLKRNILIGLATGAASVLYPYLAPHDVTLLYVAATLYIIFLWLIFQLRHTIPALKHLVQEEKSKGIYLTFQNLEDIRALRQSSWLGRCAQWAFMKKA